MGVKLYKDINYAKLKLKTHPLFKNHSQFTLEYNFNKRHIRCKIKILLIFLILSRLI